MSEISKYLKPLWVFAGGHILILVLYLFFPTIATYLAALLAVPGTEVFWGWTWAVSSARLLIVIVAELVTLYCTARSFMDIKENG